LLFLEGCHVSLTANAHRWRAIGEQVKWLAKMVDRTAESAHDRARLEKRPALMREALAADPALCAAEKKVYSRWISRSNLGK